MPDKEEKKELTNEEVLKKLEEFSRSINELKETNTKLKEENDALSRKLANVHIDSITNEIGNNKEEPVDEQIEFDFDI